MKEKIAIIGAGNMGQAIAQGILHKKIINQDQLIVTNTKTKNNKDAVIKADIIVLAIKPQAVSSVMDEIKNEVKDQLVISIMVGITISDMQQALGKKVAVVRVMPNLGARVGSAMSVWVKSKEVTEKHEAIAKKILESIGTELELQNEEQINAATAISGSGPAYFFYVTEIIEEEARKLGFSQEEARMLASQTLIGNAEVLKLARQSAEDLRHAVTSQGGTTEAAMAVFQKAKLQNTFAKGVLAALQRARELGKKKK